EAEIAVIVISLRYVVEYGFAKRIQLRIQKSDGRTELLVQQRHKAGPERRYRASASDNFSLAIDQDVVSGCWICIPCNVRNTAADKIRLWLNRNASRALITRDCKYVADTAARCSCVRCCFIPNRFGRNRVTCCLESSSSAGKGIRARGR